MSKESNVISFYVLCNKLKDVIRTGWLDWHVDRNRIESVAEHIYGVQMLAIAIQSEYNYEIDLKKVIMMIAVHELEEIEIGDLTHFQISKEDKNKIGHKAVDKVLESLTLKEDIKSLVMEFDERKTKEALFAHYCDKLECDIQSKLYDEENCVDLNNQEDNKSANHPKVKKLLDEGLSFSEMWMKYGQERYNYDENFKSISNFVLTHKINNKNKS